MEFRQIETFRAVAQARSFTKAAVATHYTQSTVSAQIKSLEESLGVALFDRLGREVSLTAAGRDFYSYAEKLLALADEARESVAGQGEPSGLLSLSAPESLCTYRLPEVLNLFNEQYPTVQIMIAQEYDLPSLEGQIEAGKVDLAFLIADPYHSPALHVESLVREEMVVVAKPGHRLVRRRAVETAELGQETVLFTETDSDRICCYGTLFRGELRAAGAFPQHYLEFHSIEAIKKCAMSGVGIALLPAIAVQQELARKELAAIRWRQEMDISTQMAWHKDKWLSPAISAFTALARQTLGGRV